MRDHRIGVVVLFFAALMLLVACSQGEQGTVDEAAQGAVETAGDAAVSAFQAAKDEYVAIAKTAVDEWNTKIEAVVAQKAELPKMAQQKLEEPMKSLLDQRDKLNSQFEKVQGAGEDTFDTEKAALETAMTELSGAFDGVAALF